MNWINWLKERFESQVYEKPVKEVAPKDISEPVITFCNLLIENPQRFSFSYFSKDLYDYYKLTDKNNRQEFIHEYFYSKGYVWKNLNFLTKDEKEYIIEKVKQFTQLRKNIKDELIRKRNDRERQRLINIYCKGGDSE